MATLSWTLGALTAELRGFVMRIFGVAVRPALPSPVVGSGYHPQPRTDAAAANTPGLIPPLILPALADGPVGSWRDCAIKILGWASLEPARARCPSTPLYRGEERSKPLFKGEILGWAQWLSPVPVLLVGLWHRQLTEDRRRPTKAGSI